MVDHRTISCTAGKTRLPNTPRRIIPHPSPCKQLALRRLPRQLPGREPPPDEAGPRRSLSAGSCGDGRSGTARELVDVPLGVFAAHVVADLVLAALQQGPEALHPFVCACSRTYSQTACGWSRGSGDRSTRSTRRYKRLPPPPCRSGRSHVGFRRRYARRRRRPHSSWHGPSLPRPPSSDRTPAGPELLRGVLVPLPYYDVSIVHLNGTLKRRRPLGPRLLDSVEHGPGGQLTDPEVAVELHRGDALEAGHVKVDCERRLAVSDLRGGERGRSSRRSSCGSPSTRTASGFRWGRVGWSRPAVAAAPLPGREDRLEPVAGGRLRGEQVRESD